MAQAVKIRGEAGDRRERLAGRDVGTQRVVSARRHGLQLCCRADHGVVVLAHLQETNARAGAGAVGLQKINPPGKVAVGAEADVDMACRLQVQAGRVAGAHHGVDVDVVMGRQGELVDAPAHGGVDVDVAQFAAGVGGRGADGDVGKGQRTGQRCRAHAAA